jgi:hypothetical protein
LDKTSVLPGLDGLLVNRAQVAEGIEEPFGLADIDGDDAVAGALPAAELFIAGQEGFPIEGEGAAIGKEPGQVLGAQQVLVLKGDREVWGQGLLPQQGFESGPQAQQVFGHPFVAAVQGAGVARAGGEKNRAHNAIATGAMSAQAGHLVFPRC